MKFYEVTEILKNRLQKRGLTCEAIDYLTSDKDFLQQRLAELDQAISLYNRFRNGREKIPDELKLINSEYTNEVFRFDLPSVKKVEAEIRRVSVATVNRVADKFSQFEFIDSMKPVSKLAGVGLVAAYRTYLLVSRPELEKRNVQVASTVEEMLVLMAFRGKVTALFRAVKPWIEDYRNEGFDRSLAEAVKKL